MSHYKGDNLSVLVEITKMNKNKIFIALDVLIMLVYLYFICFPDNVEKYTADIILFFIIVFGIPFVYFIIRSEITKKPFMNINTKSAIASVILMAIFILIDLSCGRFGDYQCLLPLEAIVCTMLGELYPNYAKTYSRKRQKN